MNSRCIFLALESLKWAELQALRLRFDPLARKVPPHITVVFPFVLDWNRDRLSALLDQQRPSLPIPFTLGKPVLMDDFLFFPLQTGREAVARMHDQLHASLPAGVRSPVPYVPHVTFGRRCEDPGAAAILREAEGILPFEASSRRLVLERIGEEEDSEIEHEVDGLMPG